MFLVVGIWRAFIERDREKTVIQLCLAAPRLAGMNE